MDGDQHLDAGCSSSPTGRARCSNVLGEGMRLFESLPRTVELEIADVVRSPHVTHLRYRVRSDSGDE